MSTGRNEKCPCGSGKKYKQCCLGKGDLTQVKRGRYLTIALSALAVIAIAVGLVVSREAGLATGAIGIILVGVWLWLTAQPPKSGSGSNPSAINFGQ